MMRRFLLLLAGLFILTSTAKSQNPMLDSLQRVLLQHPHEDTFHVDVLYQLSQHSYFVDRSVSKTYAETALSISQTLGYKKGIANASFSLAVWHYDDRDGEKSLQYLLTALKLYEEINFERGKSSSLLLIGRNYLRAKHLDKAMEYFRLSLASNELIGDSSRIATNYNYIGYVFKDLRQYDSALFYDKKYLRIQEGLKDSAGLTLGYNNLGSDFNALGNTRLALEHLTKALSIAEAIKSKYRIGLAQKSLGELYAGLNDHPKAKLFFDQALRNAKAARNDNLKEDIFAQLKLLELARQNYRAAYAYSDTLMALKDSLYSSERFKKIAELETYYGTGKKEQTIRQLEQEKDLQTFWRNILVAGVLLLLGSSYVIFHLQRSRTAKTKELLDVQHQLNDKLKEIDKLKSQFFANISHEFRTPLTLVLAPLEEQMKKKTLAADEKERLFLIKRNANRLLELVNQLLDLSKLEAGKMELYVRQGKVQMFLKAVVASFHSWAQLKQINFIQNFDLNNETLFYDHDKLEKIITNLLANAFKFTPAGGTVTFAASLEGTDSAPILHICVSDTGKGIPEEEQQKVFLPFYQTRQRTEANHGGTGLGLSLVKELVKLYNGELTLESKVGAGTTICVKLPAFKEAFESEQIHFNTEDSSGYIPAVVNGHVYGDVDIDVEEDVAVSGKDLIIIAEDSTDLRNFMVSVLKEKFTVLTAEDGEEALRLTIQMVPSLVLTDLMMPKMDGFQLTAKIKEDERTSHIPVVLLTARNEQQSKLAGLKTGADDYLTKPFSTEELFVRISNLIDQRKLLADRFRERVLVPSTPLSEASLDDRFLQRIREIVELYISDPSFTVERMAEEAHLSRTQLLRKLKALTGLSPNDFIKDLRLKRAAEMITQRVDTITQIGYAVGFNDQSYFTKCFKKQFGVTPTEFSVPSNEAKRA